jgi:hypothetical protein
MHPLVLRAGRIAAVAMLAGGISGIVSPASALEEGQAEVRVVHNSPDAPPVDIFVNGERAVENLAFGEDTGLVALPAGDIDVAVAPAGSPATDAVISATLPLESCASYEVAAVGELANIGAQVYPIDTTAIPDGKARVRAIHNSPDAPAVDIAVKDGPVLFSGLAFPDASAYAEVDAGTYDLEIRPAGTTDVALAVPGVALESGTIYDVFANGKLSDGTLGVKPVTAMPEPCATPADAAAGGTTEPAVGGMSPTEMPVAGVGPMESPLAGWALAAAAVTAAAAFVLGRRRLA